MRLSGSFILAHWLHANNIKCHRSDFDKTQRTKVHYRGLWLTNCSSMYTQIILIVLQKINIAVFYCSYTKAILFLFISKKALISNNHKSHLVLPGANLNDFLIIFPFHWQVQQISQLHHTDIETFQITAFQLLKRCKNTFPFLSLKSKTSAPEWHNTNSQYVFTSLKSGHAL